MNVKVVLSGLWTAMLFVFAYVDIFTFLRADMINGVLEGKVPISGFTINQGFLVYTTIYILVPALMIAVSLLAPARINRPANLVVSLLYAASVVVAAVGDVWYYYFLGSAVEVLLLLAIARAAWAWPRRSAEWHRTEGRNRSTRRGA